MPRELERDLGLYATVTVSVGAMIGSGIFVLPGLAAKIAGPAVVVAYLLAGLLVLPAALSKAEMATAMPESGGTYLYIDRAMGPLPGTVAGLGAWFSLVFKSAFALVGLGAYLLLFVDLSDSVVTAVALGLGTFLLVVNVAGVKQTGRLQATIVSLVVVVLFAFVADGLTYVEGARYHPFFATGGGGLLAATGFVFVSYAGVTKIASVAEEVEDPGRNIPAGILLSIGVMMLVYTGVVYVVVGVAPHDALMRDDMLTPMALAAGEFLGRGGELAVAGVAVLALTSMANAGVLSSSRFPLAMARDALAPDSLAVVDDRFKTPVNAIGLTGGVLLVLVALVPVRDLAKLASAFQILVFAFVNAALVAFRESDLSAYDPEFVAPGYPWVQLFGIGGGVVLLTQMGAVPLVGAVGIVVAGVAWYRVYGRERTEREGAALDAIRRSTKRFSLERVRERIAGGAGRSALVAVRPETSLNDERTLLSVAGDVVDEDGSVTLARFDEVPDQTTLASVADEESEHAHEADLLADGLGIDTEVTDVVTHDIEEGVVHYAASHGQDLVVGAWEPDYFHGEMLGHDIDWYMNHGDADLLFVRDRGYEDIDEVSVVAERGVYDTLSVQAADAIASAHGATVTFLYPLAQDASDEQAASTEEYLETLVDLCSVAAEYRLFRTDDPEKGVYSLASESDVAVVTTSSHSLLYDVLVGTLPDRLVRDLPCTVVLAHANRSRTATSLRYVLERVAF
ncbi:MAG: amino acid permease [Haloarculaceae archaeon]